MFTLRRIIRDRKPVTNYICTSSIIRSDESKKLDDESKKSVDEPKKENEKQNLIYKNETSPHISNVSVFFKNVKKEIRSKSTERQFKISTVKTEVDKITEFDKKSSKEAKRDPKARHKIDFFKKVLTSSAEKVAENIGGDKKQTKRDLLDYIKTFEVSKEKPEEGKDFLLTPLDTKGISMMSKFVGKAKFTGTFKLPNRQNWENQVELSTWNALEAEDLQYVGRKHPNNYFEELIQWTNDGRLWHFPIDNDQGREKEAEVSFTEHIFLEQHLEPWCPKRGPLRRFMELVLIGLAKNHHLSVEDKKEHIAWFEKYFESKKKVLQELGAVGSTKQIDVPNQENS